MNRQTPRQAPRQTPRQTPRPTRSLIWPLATAVLAAGCAQVPGGHGRSSAGVAAEPTATGPSGCQPLGMSRQQATAAGALVGGLLGGLVGRDISRNKGVGTRNGLLLGALAGGLAGSQLGSGIKMIELDDGSVRLDIPGSVLFPSGSHAVSDGFKPTLDRVGRVIQQYCGLTAQVVGHTDSIGRPADNKVLSLDRARAVVAYLTGMGVPAGRLSFDGMGQDRPVADNGSDQGRQQNRRVEIFVRPPAS